MQIVHAGNGRDLQQRLLQLRQIDFGRRAFHQDMDGLTQELPGARDDEESSAGPDDLIGRRPACVHDAGPPRSQRTEHVAEYLEIGPWTLLRLSDEPAASSFMLIRLTIRPTAATEVVCRA